MVNNFVRLIISIFIITVIIELEAKPLNDEIDSKSTKCGNLIWTQNDDKTWDVKKKKNISSIEEIQVWWPSLGRCVDLTAESICEDGGSTIINSQLEGTCDCQEPYTAIENQPGCHQYYDQGPCAKGEVITYDEGLKKGVCSKDSCAKENENVKNYYHRFVEVYGNGTCYSLSDREACSLHEKAVLKFKKIPQCNRSRLESFVLFPPVCVPSNDKFNCRVHITEKEERDKYITELKMDLE